MSLGTFKTPQLPDDLDPDTIPNGAVPVYDTATHRWRPAVQSGGGGGGGAVSSVNGKTGAVVLDAGDVGAEPAGSGTSIRNVSGTVTLDAIPGLVEVYATSAATVQTVELDAGDAAVFRYLSGEWTYMVVGEHTTWQTIEATPIPVTADAPTWTDDTVNGGGSWTTPTITGVTYSPASGTATPGQSVTVTATAQPGYTLTGTTSWTHVFPTDPGDTTDPTPGTLGYSDVTDTSFTLTVSGASDDEGLHAQPYAFSLDGGTTWTGWQSSASYAATGLDDDTTYQCRHKVRDAALNEALGTTVNVTTEAASGGLPLIDTFTAPDSTDVVGRTVSGFTWALDANNDLNTTPVGSPVITGNAARTSSGVRAAVLDVAATTVRVSAKVTVSADAVHGAVRLGLGGGRTSGGNVNGLYLIIEKPATPEIKCYWDNGTGSIKQVGSTYSGGVAPGQTKTVSVEYVGTAVTVKLDGVTIITGSNVILTGTKVGFSIHPGTAGYFAVDDFTVEAL